MRYCKASRQTNSRHYPCNITKLENQILSLPCQCDSFPSQKNASLQQNLQQGEGATSENGKKPVLEGVKKVNHEQLFEMQTESNYTVTYSRHSWRLFAFARHKAWQPKWSMWPLPTTGHKPPVLLDNTTTTTTCVNTGTQIKQWSSCLPHYVQYDITNGCRANVDHWSNTHTHTHLHVL